MNAVVNLIIENVIRAKNEIKIYIDLSVNCQ